jgi:hypothetical protein
MGSLQYSQGWFLIRPPHRYPCTQAPGRPSMAPSSLSWIHQAALAYQRPNDDSSCLIGSPPAFPIGSHSNALSLGLELHLLRTNECSVLQRPRATQALNTGTAASPAPISPPFLRPSPCPTSHPSHSSNPHIFNSSVTSPESLSPPTQSLSQPLHQNPTFRDLVKE